MKAATSLLLLPLLLMASIVAHVEKSNAPQVFASEPCSAAQLPKFRSAVFAQAKDPKQLWKIVSPILCDAEQSSDRTTPVYSHLAKSVRHVQEDADSKRTVQMVARSKELVADMVLATTVHYAELSLPSKTQAMLEYSGDICSRCIHANYRNGQWLIGEYISGCD